MANRRVTLSKIYILRFLARISSDQGHFVGYIQSLDWTTTRIDGLAL